MTEIKVSQRAREAAADRFEAAFGPNDLSCEMRQGLHDCDPMAQAFARFEQAVRADEREVIAIYLESVAAKRSDRMKIATIRAQGDEA